jgi:3-hydroxyacyl-[acyl-carrier-protein] dehydratase
MSSNEKGGLEDKPGTPVAATRPEATQSFDQLDVRKILSAIPHRYPFLLVDRIINLVDNQELTCIKNVSFNEPFFQGHFPGRPVMPGVLQVEAVAQACALLAKLSTKGVPAHKVILLVGLDGVKFKRQVVPGDTLTITVKFQKKRGPLWILEGEATINGEFVMSATISAVEAD